MDVPVLYDLDDGEATGTVHYFCCTACRSQSPLKLPDNSNAGTADYIPDEFYCELCMKLVRDE